MLSRTIAQSDANLLRGIAILAIMLHNYFHVLEQTPGEQEFIFSIGITLRFLHNLANQPYDLVRQVFSFLGHYGVQIFVFLSGYGLALRYRSEHPIDYKKFVIERLQRLYPVLLVAVLGLLCYKAAVALLFPYSHINLSTFIWEALLKLSLLSNLVPDQALSITGPWWFFSMIFQLYLIAPLLLQVRRNSTLIMMIVAAWSFQIGILFFSGDYIEYFRLNFIGHLPEFCLGILLAKEQKGSFSKTLALCCFVLFVLGSFYPIVWVLSFTCIPVLAVTVYQRIRPVRDNLLSRLVHFFGKNSLYFFAVHSLCRPPFVALGNRSIAWSLLAAVLYLLVVTVITLIFRQAVRYFELFYIKLGIATIQKHNARHGNL